jgi:hypothetical protein
MAYLTIDRYKVLALIPGGYVDEVEGMAPGFTAAQLDTRSDWIDAQLRKRYATPFKPPVPGIIEQWLALLVTPDLMVKRGVNATDEQFEYMERRAAFTAEAIQQAANSEVGLYDLPLRDDVTGTGIAHAATRVYSEQSPYVGADIQAEIGRAEDRARYGSGTS